MPSPFMDYFGVSHAPFKPFEPPVIHVRGDGAAIRESLEVIKGHYNITPIVLPPLNRIMMDAHNLGIPVLTPKLDEATSLHRLVSMAEGSKEIFSLIDFMTLPAADAAQFDMGKPHFALQLWMKNDAAKPSHENKRKAVFILQAECTPSQKGSYFLWQGGHIVTGDVGQDANGWFVKLNGKAAENPAEPILLGRAVHGLVHADFMAPPKMGFPSDPDSGPDAPSPSPVAPARPRFGSGGAQEPAPADAKGRSRVDADADAVRRFRPIKVASL